MSSQKQKDDLDAGITVYVHGSAKNPYELRNVEGTYSCSCVSWRLQKEPINRRTCKHLQLVRGLKEEMHRIAEDDIEKLGRAFTGATSVRTRKAIEANKISED